jgi:hypothetical protein
VQQQQRPASPNSSQIAADQSESTRLCARASSQLDREDARQLFRWGWHRAKL